MKIHPFILIASLAILLACRGEAPKQQVLAEKIQYDVPVNNNDPRIDWWVNNIEGSKREPFLKRVFEAAQKGEVRVYDYFNNPLKPSQILADVTDTIYRTLMRVRPPYEEYDTMIIKTVSYRDIEKIRFMEEWTWDPKTLEIEKKVIAIGPVIQKKYAGESYNQLLFWIYLDERYPVK